MVKTINKISIMGKQIKIIGIMDKIINRISITALVSAPKAFLRVLLTSFIAPLHPARLISEKTRSN